MLFFNISNFYRTFLFELHAGGVKLLDGQDLFSAFESFYQLAFTFQLEYGEKSQTVAEIIQLRIAKGSYKYYVIRDGVGGGKGKDNTLITCPGWQGGGGR